MDNAEMFAKLAHQSLGRSLQGSEAGFADALEAIYIAGISDFSEVAAALTQQSIPAPHSGKTKWDIALLEAELSIINASLDQAYGSGQLSA